MKNQSIRSSWTLAQELDYELTQLRAGKPLDHHDDMIRGNLMAEEISALKREVGALQRAAGLPHLTLVAG